MAGLPTASKRHKPSNDGFTEGLYCLHGETPQLMLTAKLKNFLCGKSKPFPEIKCRACMGCPYGIELINRADGISKEPAEAMKIKISTESARIAGLELKRIKEERERREGLEAREHRKNPRMARERSEEWIQKMRDGAEQSAKAHRLEMVGYFQTIYEAPDPIALLMQIEEIDRDKAFRRLRYSRNKYRELQ